VGFFWRFAVAFVRITCCAGCGPLCALDSIFDFGAIYIFCLFISYAYPLILFFHFFLTYLLPYLYFPLRTDLLRFQAGCRKRTLNLAFVFLCVFCLVVHFFWLVNARFCCVRVSFFRTKPRDWLGETSPKWTGLCRVGCKATTQWVSVIVVAVLVPCQVVWTLRLPWPGKILSTLTDRSSRKQRKHSSPST